MELEIETTVIIPTYNRVLFLKKAIDSVLAQTYKNFELMVIDDGSTDETPELISTYGKTILYIRQKNQGPSAARNTGIQNAHGRYLAFLDSDDTWKKEKLAIQTQVMFKNPDFLISHTDELWYRRGKILNQKKKHAKYNGYIFDKCLPLCAVGMSTVMAKKELFKKIGLFDTSLPCCEDYDLWLRASVQHPFLLINKALTVKDGGREDQVSRIYAVGMDKFRIKSLIKILEGEKKLTLKQRDVLLHELQKKCRVYGTGCFKHGKNEEGEFYLKLPKKYEAQRLGQI